MSERFELHDPILEEAIKIKEELVAIMEPLQTTEVPTTKYWEDLVDVRIGEKTPLLTPEEVVGAIPLTERMAFTTLDARENITSILKSEDDRLVVITGPCSIHSAQAAVEYGEWIAEMREIYGDSLEIIMRVFMEKPRSGLDWKGLFNDPMLDKSYDLNLGFVLARLVASTIAEMGVPNAMERLNTSNPQYLNGLVAYDAIGARNVYDQNAKEYASGSSSPVGVKNSPEGTIEAAVEAARVITAPQVFPGTAPNGRPMRVPTLGNDTAHVILRGSNQASNYNEESIDRTIAFMVERGLIPAVVIDASHGNSQKDHTKQQEVIEYVGGLIGLGKQAIKGVMIESNLQAGKQKLGDPSELVYGQSITDSCVDLDQTEDMLSTLELAVQRRRKALNKNYHAFTII